MKKVILFLFLVSGVISFSANYSKGKAVELKFIKISQDQYGFDLTYYPEKDGVGKDEPLKARESKHEAGIAVKKGNTYYYEGMSYGELCKIEITENSKNITVKTNEMCAAYTAFDGTYKYTGETSAKDTEAIKEYIEVNEWYDNLPDSEKRYND